MKWVLREDLKTFNESACLMCKGSSFHSFGAVIELTSKFHNPTQKSRQQAYRVTQLI